MPTLLLIDGHSQAYRAYFGMKTPLATRSGELTAAVYGFARKLLSILKEYKPDYVAVAFDLGDTWRHAEFAEYKATRERMPDEMRTQMTRIQQFLQTFNIPIVTYPNYEADDVLGTLARQAAAQETDVLILTGDRDMFQLVDDRVRILYTPGGPSPKTNIVGPEEVMSRYGISAQQFIDLKALTGDSSDNIPGIPGVGEKTAIKFLQEYSTLENLYDHVDEIRGPKTRQNVIDAKAQVELNQRLVTIVTDLQLTYDAEECRVQDYDRDAVVDLFTELEFRSLIKDLPGEETGDETDNLEDSAQMSLFVQQAAPAPAEDNYHRVQDAQALADLVEALQSAKRLSFDVETTGTDAVTTNLVGLGIAWDLDKAAYIPVAHNEGEQLPWDQVREALQPFFLDPDLPKFAHNGKFDLTVCRQHGLEIAGPIHDTLTLAWLLDPASRALGLKAQAAAVLGIEMTELTDLIGTGRKQITMAEVEIDSAAAYCGADVDLTLQLFDKLRPQLEEAGMWPLYEELELPLLPILTDMELTGIQLDSDYLQQMSQSMTQRLSELQAELFKIVGHEFNLRSTQQMSQVLFEEMAFPTKRMKRTRSGHYSTAVAELEKLAAKRDVLNEDQWRMLQVIFEQRQLEKLRGTYVDALPGLVNPNTGRLHTNFNQTGAVTGRMSSSNPNLQNIPIRTEQGRAIRRAFVVPANSYLISADYSQVELRVLAHIAGEEALIESFKADHDIHAATASRLFDVAIDQVDRQQRGVAKTINFATVYGSSAFGISSRTDMSPKEAERFLDQYFATYPKIKEYVATTTELAHNQGYVETLLGRKRFFPELSAGRLPHNQRLSVERAAVNAPIQGTAADIMKIAMIRLHERLVREELQTRMLLQVHDELVIEVPHEERDQVVHLVREVMEAAYQLVVPLKVDVEIGPNWYDLEPA